MGSGGGGIAGDVERGLDRVTGIDGFTNTAVRAGLAYTTYGLSEVANYGVDELTRKPKREAEKLASDQMAAAAASEDLANTTKTRNENTENRDRLRLRQRSAAGSARGSLVSNPLGMPAIGNGGGKSLIGM